MSSFLYRLGLFVTKHAKSVFATCLVVLIVCATAAMTLGGRLNDNFSIPNTESQEGMEILNEQLPELAGTYIQLVFHNKDDSSIYSNRKTIEDFIDRLNDTKGVAIANNPFVKQIGGTTTAISHNKRYALLQVQLTSTLENVDMNLINDLKKQAEQVGAANGMDVTIGGNAFTTTEVRISGFEAVGVALALIVLAVTFGSLIAAGLPLASALIAVGISMSIIMSIAAFTDLSKTTPTLAVMLGLAVGIDYSLFILHRYRQLLRDGGDVRASICFAMATSGGAVVFAGVTVVIALCGLMLAGIPFLTGIGLCAAMGVSLSVIISLTALPSLMCMLGERLRPKPKKRRIAHRADDAPRTTLNHWWVRTTTRHPLVTIIAVVLIVGALAYPAKDLYLSLPDNGSEPPGTPARVTYDLVKKEFGPGANGQLILTSDIINTTDPLGVMRDMGRDLQKLDGVESIQVSTPNRTASIGVTVVIPTTSQDDPKTSQLVDRIRKMAPELEKRYNISNIRVTGFTAATIDVSHKLSQALLPFGLVVVGLSIVLLLIVFRSIVVPIKATFGYIASVLSGFGVTSMVFTHGWGADILHVQHTGTVLSFMPIIVMGVLFGLAMDYEVFLVSRMREEYVLTRKPMKSIHDGFASSATVVTAAALIMTFVFSSFIPDGDFYVQQMALGLAVGVAVDAFLVRMTLVPAVMALLGHKTWWLPAWLERKLPAFDIEGEAISRRINYKTWEINNGAASVKLENVAVHDGLEYDSDAPGMSAIIRPGSLIELVGTSAEIQAACALLCGRVSDFSGQAYIAGYNLRDEPQLVHGHTLLLDMRDVDASTHVLDAKRYSVVVADIGRDSVDDIGYVTVDAIERIRQYVHEGGTFVCPAAVAPILELDGTQLDCHSVYPLGKEAVDHATA